MKKNIIISLFTLAYSSNIFASNLDLSNQNPSPSPSYNNEANEAYSNSKWNKTPYIGLQYGLGGNLFAGYGKTFGQSQRYYLGIEPFLMIGLYKPYGVGLSINPGYLLTPFTLAYSRMGASISSEWSGPMLGLGVQTNLRKNWDFRIELNTNNLLQLGVIYKF